MHKLDDIEELALNNSFDANGISDNDGDGFEALERLHSVNNTVPENIKRAGNEFGKTNTIPFTLYTDEFTATQLTVLLGMIRYCLEKSAEGRSGDNKEFSFNVKVRNRSNVDFLFSIGDESMPSLPVEKEVYIGH